MRQSLNKPMAFAFVAVTVAVVDNCYSGFVISFATGVCWRFGGSYR